MKRQGKVSRAGPRSGRDLLIRYQVPIHIKRLKEHDRIKQRILQEIRAQDFKPYEVETSYISKCDYPAPKDVERRYLRFLHRPISTHIREVMKRYGYESLRIYNIFFQQYETNSRHDWHVHVETQWVGVYYVELPKTTPKTEYIAMTSGDMKRFPCQEGDVVLFPSFIIHRAPRNLSTETKTIISFNFDCNIARTF